jgi:hypothetical protein
VESAHPLELLAWPVQISRLTVQARKLWSLPLQVGSIIHVLLNAHFLLAGLTVQLGEYRPDIDLGTIGPSRGLDTHTLKQQILNCASTDQAGGSSIA